MTADGDAVGEPEGVVNWDKIPVTNVARRTKNEIMFESRVE